MKKGAGFIAGRDQQQQPQRRSQLRGQATLGKPGQSQTKNNPNNQLTSGEMVIGVVNYLARSQGEKGPRAWRNRAPMAQTNCYSNGTGWDHQRNQQIPLAIIPAPQKRLAQQLGKDSVAAAATAATAVATTTTSAAAAAVAATGPAAATAIATTTGTAAAAATAAGLSLVDPDHATHPLDILKLVDGLGFLGISGKLNKRKTALATRVPIEGQAALLQLPILGKQALEVFHFGIEGKITHVNCHERKTI